MSQPGYPPSNRCDNRLLAIGLLLAATSGANASEKPNVLVFFVDDMGWTDWQYDAAVNPTGSPVYETPHMLQLAERGITFEAAYASAPVCSPTRASLLTGQSVARHHVSDHTGGGSNQSATLRSPNFPRGLPTSAITFAESLGSVAGGYHTGFVGKWHAGSNPIEQGFDSNIAGGGAGCPCDGEGGFFAGPDGRWSGMPGIDAPGTYPSDTYLTDVLAGFAEDYIEQQAVSPNPFLLLFAPYQVHVPLQAPAATVSKYSAKIAALENQGVDLRGHDNAIYAAMLEEMDTALGRALARLDDPNGDGDTADSIRDDTIVMFASDNGGLTISELGSAPATENAPLRDGKGSLYEGGIRTPFIVSWTGNPQMAQGVTTSARVSTHDIYPTLLEVTGLSENPALQRGDDLDGVSFAAALEGNAHERGYQFWHYPHQSNQHKLSGGSVTGGSFVSAIRDDTHKMIFFYETRAYERFDLSSDIGETTNLMGADPAAEFAMSLELHAYLKRSGAAMPVRRSDGSAVDLPPVLWLTTQGDFTGDGALDAADWVRLKNSFGADVSNVAALVAYQAHGDINLDGVVNRVDFADFKQAFASANGAGSFEKMLAGVPEPTSAAIAALLLLMHGGGRAHW